MPVSNSNTGWKPAIPVKKQLTTSLATPEIYHFENILDIEYKILLICIIDLIIQKLFTKLDKNTRGEKMFNSSKVLLVLFILLSLSLSCLAELPADFNNMGTYKALRITDSTGNKSILTNAHIGEGIILADSSSTDFNQIIKLESRLGDNRVFGSIIGSLLGSITGATIIVISDISKINLNDSSKDNSMKESTAYWSIFASAAGGGLLGFLIGKEIPIFSTLYNEDTKIGILSPKLGLDISVSDVTQNSSIYAGLKYRF